MELILGLSAILVLMFGGRILLFLVDLGFETGDRFLAAFERRLTLYTKALLRGMVFAIHWVFHRFYKPEPEQMTIRSIIDSPAELQHMRNQHLLQSRKRAPVEIEYSQPKLKGK